jgi:hypothetical protein
VTLGPLRFTVLFGALAFWTARATAAPGDATRLEFDRAASCPDQTALKDAVVKRLGYDPFFPAARQTIVVEITDESATLHAQMHLIDENGIIRGSRDLHERAEHCDELVASLALAISIALDPSAMLSEKPEPTARQDAAAAAPPDTGTNADKTAGESAEPEPPPAASARVPAAKHPAPPQKNQPTDETSTTHIGLRAAAFSAFDVAPAPALGWKGGVSLRERRFELVAEFADQLPVSRDLTKGSVRASVLAGTAAACFSQAQFAGCALTSVGSFRSEGLLVSIPHRQGSLYVALGARVEYLPTLMGRLHLLFNLDVTRNVTPLSLRTAGQEVWKTPILSLAAGLGLEAIFP